MNVDSIPARLREVDQWVVWKQTTTKIPFQISGVPASVADPTTWSSFGEALRAYEAGAYSGLGFVFTSEDPFCGIDFDGCRNPETGKTKAWAVEWLQRLESYCEVSPSQTGWKVFTLGRSKLPTGKNRKLDGDAVGGKQPGIEIYDHGRWFAVTGEVGRYREVVDSQSTINEICDTYWPPEVHRTHTHTSRPDDAVAERARRYVATMPSAVEHERGHDRAFTVACRLVLGFGLTPEQAYPLFCEYSERCVPPWSEKEIWHKLRSADKQPGERNYLRNARDSDWSTVEVPEYREPDAPQFITLRSAAEKYLDKLENSGGSTLIDLGLPEVTYALGGGVEQGELVIIGARPSHGKSAFALQILHECSANGRECLMVSEEMSALALGKRTLQYVTDVREEYWLQDRQIVQRHIDNHFEGRKKIHVVENCRTSQNVDAAIGRAVRDHGVTVVAVDYAQLLASKGSNQYERVSEVSKDLAHMAHAHDVLLVVLCQLSRDIEKRDRFTPKTTDLRDSGQLEQDADVILFTVWPHRIDQTVDANKYQVFIQKNRHRPINQPAVICRFNPSRQKFLECRPEPQPIDEWAR